MSKKIAVGVLSTMLLAGVFSFAPVSSTQAQNMSLEQLVNLLISIGVIPADKATTARAAVSAAGASGASTGSSNSAGPSSSSSASSCHSFTRDLTVGSSGADVVALNKILSDENISERIASQNGYFDEFTAGHVVKYQERYGIRATGYVGPLTRARLNACVSPTTSSITVTYPTAGLTFAAGGEISIAFANPVDRELYRVAIRGKAYEESLGSVTAEAADQMKAKFILPLSIPSGSYNIVVYPYGKGVEAYSPAFNVTNSSSQIALSASCSGSAGAEAVKILWRASAAGGSGAYTYSWSVYNDVKAYIGGSTQSSSFTSTYNSAGLKQAYIRVSDTSGKTAAAECSSTIPEFTTTVTASPFIKILSPSGSEVWDQNTERSIRWSYGDMSGNENISVNFIFSDGFICKNGTGPVYHWLNVIPSSAGCSNEITRNLRGGGSFKVQLIATNSSGSVLASATSNSFSISPAATQTSTLSVSCSGTANVDSVKVTWTASASGGSGSNSYSWSAYNDVSAYTGGSTQSSTFTASYSSAGTKQAYVTVRDSSGKTAAASCSSIIDAKAPATVAPAPITAGPSATFSLSSNSITLGQSVTLTSVTNSPSSSLKNAAIDLSTDNYNWSSGAPCGYWSNTGGALATKTISCSYTPSTAGTYYFRTRGTDNNGVSDFKNQTLTVTAPAPVVQAVPISASCSGSANSDSVKVTWSASASGGSGSYTYSWSAYNDVSSYTGGSTASASFTASYGSAGTKQAYVTVRDSSGNSANASCSATIAAAAVQAQPAPSRPTTTFSISSQSINLGGSITLTSTTNSPAGTLQAAAIDQLSSDGSYWMSGAPCGYWNAPSPRASHTITCSYTPSAAGTYYFRSRGQDSVGLSDFVNQTLVVNSDTSMIGSQSNLGSAFISFEDALRVFNILR